jgi:sterol desaturase/sphingolipid hydroxylase (fatty acid hydroxylase superfamily)
MISDNIYINISFWICYIFALIIGTEIFAYLWHRYAAHDDYIPGIHETHQIHHTANNEHEADEDFVWILLMMVFIELIMGIAVIIGIIPGAIALVTVIIALTVFWWNWWIHRAYHQSDHWLNSFEWFQIEKQRHYVHHDNPKLNYGIASHFTDKIMNTWKDPSIDIVPPSNIFDKSIV